MKLLSSCLLLILLVATLQSCGDNSIKEGKIVYAIDYPNHKDNFFLYSILPKEMELNFKDGKMQSVINKANLKNALLVDCNTKDVGAYFQYGTESFNVQLNPDDVQKMLSDQKKYKIKFVDETKEIAGFDAKKAIATCVTDQSDKIELWYTEEIQMKNSNWYNPFKEVPGVLLVYAIDRYGIRMEFKAKRFEDVSISDEQLALPKTGVKIPYVDYNNKLNDLFKSFE